MINYLRQVSDLREEHRLIKDGYFELLDKLDFTQKEMHKASTLRMIMSGHYRHEWFDNEVSPNMADYMKLPLPERVSVVTEYHCILTDETFKSLRYADPYKSLYEGIRNYYQTSAVVDIDIYLNSSVSPEDMRTYSRLMLQKLRILKHNQGAEHIAQSKQLYMDLYNTLMHEGLQFDAANVLMTFIDECSSPFNLLLHHPTNQEPISVSDFLELNPPPAPMFHSDGIHLIYPCLNMLLLGQFGITALYENEISKYIDTLISLYNTWSNHPNKVQFSVAIAVTLMQLGKRNDAEPFLNFFKAQKLAPAHFAPWFRKMVTILEQEVGDATNTCYS
jgi:hypothetical protein